MAKRPDDSIFKTPTPSATSTVTKTKKRSGLKDLDIPKLNISATSADISLGLLSLNSDTSDIANYTKSLTDKRDINTKLQKERQLAYAQLQNQSKFIKADIKEDKYNFSKRNTKLQPSRGESSNMFSDSLSLLSDELRKGNDSIKNLCKQYDVSVLQQSLDLSREEFLSGEDAAALLNADEMSWCKQYALPNATKDFSKLSIAGDKSVSIGNYFLDRCQNLSELSLQKTPTAEKSTINANFIEDPVRDVSINDASINNSYSKSDSLSLSKIQRVLSDSKIQTPGRCLDYLYGMNRSAIEENVEFTSSQFTPVINSTLSDDIDEHKEVLNENYSQSGSLMLSKSCSIHVEDSLKNLNKTKGNKENVPNSCCCTANSSPRISPNTTRDSINNKDKSIISTRTASSLNTFAEGKIPIRVSQFEMIWGNVKVGKRQSQDLLVKNLCNKRIHFVMNLDGSNYRILKDASSSDYLTSVNVVMHPHETKPFTVTFNPLKIGACVEKLRFTSLQQDKVDNRRLKLYGYGGHISLTFDGVYKDSVNSMRLNLGKFDYENCLKKEIWITNSGNLCAFATLHITTKNFNFLSIPQITTPSNIVLPPNGKAKVNILYAPTRADLDYLKTFQSEIVHIGSLRIIYGSEATRGRIRRLNNKLLQNNNSVDTLAMKISESFTNESMPIDLNQFTETAAGMPELMKQLTDSEIMLTLEQNLDTTLIGNVNESMMFQSLLDDETVLENTILNKPPVNNVTVMPRNIVLMPPSKCNDVIILMSHTDKLINFRAKVEHNDKVRIYPSEGILRSNEKCVINISCNSVYDFDHFNMFVYLDEDVVDIDVKVLH